MNHTEQQAYDWLRRFFRLEDGDVEYQPDIPEFRTKGGRLWGVKRLYFGKTAVFYPGELRKLTSNLERTVLLLFDDRPDPVKQIAVRNLVDNPNSYENFRFAYRYDPNQQQNGSGEIIVPITRRNPNSRYWRVNHFPMDSCNWYQGHFDAQLVKSVDGGNRLGAFLVLRPAL